MVSVLEKVSDRQRHVAIWNNVTWYLKYDLKKSPIANRQSWNHAFGDFKNDIINTQWLRGLGWFFALTWIVGLILSVASVSLITTFTSTNSACQPDGSFRLHPETFSVWSSSGFFQITLGAGHLTFAEAKVIDIVWDIASFPTSISMGKTSTNTLQGVGRGGQCLLALVSWRVFAKYLTMCMDLQPVNYQLFRTIFLENEASLPSTYRTIRGFLWQRKLRSKTAMVFMVATMVFILAFPTLTSAMSGYDANVSPYIPDDNGSFLPFEEFNMVLYVIHDGWRINKTGEHYIIDFDSKPGMSCA
jgi:hypothetical protein